MSSIGFLESKGFNEYQRFLLFFLVCIPLRFSFPVIAHKLRYMAITKTVLLLIGIISVVTNVKSIKGKPWWSRRFHSFSSVLLILSAILSFFSENNAVKSLPSTILLLDVLFGIGTYLVVSPFNKK